VSALTRAKHNTALSTRTTAVVTASDADVDAAQEGMPVPEPTVPPIERAMSTRLHQAALDPTRRHLRT
jgi:hypothetical protein